MTRWMHRTAPRNHPDERPIHRRPSSAARRLQPPSPHRPRQRAAPSRPRRSPEPPPPARRHCRQLPPGPSEPHPRREHPAPRHPRPGRHPLLYPRRHRHPRRSPHRHRPDSPGLRSPYRPPSQAPPLFLKLRSRPLLCPRRPRPLRCRHRPQPWHHRPWVPVPPRPRQPVRTPSPQVKARPHRPRRPRPDRPGKLSSPLMGDGRCGRGFTRSTRRNKRRWCWHRPSSPHPCSRQATRPVPPSLPRRASQRSHLSNRRPRLSRPRRPSRAPLTDRRSRASPGSTREWSRSSSTR